MDIVWLRKTAGSDDQNTMHLVQLQDFSKAWAASFNLDLSNICGTGAPTPIPAPV